MSAQAGNQIGRQTGRQSNDVIQGELNGWTGLQACGDVKRISSNMTRNASIEQMASVTF